MNFRSSREVHRESLNDVFVTCGAEGKFRTGPKCSGLTFFLPCSFLRTRQPIMHDQNSTSKSWQREPLAGGGKEGQKYCTSSYVKTLESFLPEKGAFAEGTIGFFIFRRKKWRHKFHNSQRDVMRKFKTLKKQKSHWVHVLLSIDIDPPTTTTAHNLLALSLPFD
jgi:hypothetical protein